MNPVCGFAFQNPSPAGLDPAQRWPVQDEPTRSARTWGPDHWVYLDRWWAKQLGVTRTAGRYRIRSRDLGRGFAPGNRGLHAQARVPISGGGCCGPRERETAA
jgi:hypothetical protein